MFLFRVIREIRGRLKVSSKFYVVGGAQLSVRSGRHQPHRIGSQPYGCERASPCIETNKRREIVRAQSVGERNEIREWRQPAVFLAILYDRCCDSVQLPFSLLSLHSLESPQKVLEVLPLAVTNTNLLNHPFAPGLLKPEGRSKPSLHGRIPLPGLAHRLYINVLLVQEVLGQMYDQILGRNFI